MVFLKKKKKKKLKSPSLPIFGFLGLYFGAVTLENLEILLECHGKRYTKIHSMNKIKVTVQLLSSAFWIIVVRTLVLLFHHYSQVSSQFRCSKFQVILPLSPRHTALLATSCKAAGKALCSASFTLSDKVSSVSPISTGTASWKIIAPASTSSYR